MNHFCGCGSGKTFKKCCHVRMNAPFIGPELPPAPPPTAEEKQAADRATLKAKLEFAALMTFLAPTMAHFEWQDRMLRSNPKAR